MKTITLSVCILLSVVTAHAQTSTKQLFATHFGSGANSLSTKLKCPGRHHMDRTAITVYCQAIVDVDGKALNGSHCFDREPGGAQFAKDVKKSVLDSHFMPATINGEKLKTLFSFRVFTTRSKDQCSVTLIPNLGYQSNKFGVDYVAPQEILTKGSWTIKTKNFERDPKTRVFVNAEGFLFTMSVAVTNTGEASDARMEWNRLATKKESRSILKALNNSVFIPGIYQGKPQAMRYYEFLYRQTRY